MHTVNNKLKMMTIFCFMFTFLSLATAYSNPATGYELSLYESTPLIVWVGLILSISGGVFILIHQVSTEEYKRSNFWLIGLFLLIINRMCLLYIPYIRGYYSWRGDNISHVGLFKDILIEGHFTNNTYPITHILLAEIVQISGLSIEFVGNHSTAVYSVIFVISIYLLASSVFTAKKTQILAVASISCVLFNIYDVFVMPNGWSLLYLPILFFFYFKSLTNKQNIQYTILYIVVLILYPFFHPLSATMIIMMLLTIGITKYLLNTIENKKIHTRIFSYIPMRFILVEFIIFVPWMLSFQRFHPNIINFYVSITTGISPNVIDSMGNTLDKINLTGIDFLEFILRSMGDEIIYLILSLASFIILFNSSTKEKKLHENLQILLALTFFVGSVYAAYLFNIVPGLENFDSGRLPAYLVIFTPISAGFVFSHLLDRKITIERFNITPIICLIIIMSASLISIFSLYPSPYIVRPNPEVTEMDISGATWVLNYKNSSISHTNILSPLDRFADGVLGTSSPRGRINIHDSEIPDHFNYTNHTYLGNSYREDRYSMITKLDTVVYETVWDAVGRFDKEDFEKLNFDSTVDKLYSNGETKTYYIHNKGLLLE